MHFLKVRSRHGSHDAIRGKVPSSVRALIRFGSSTPVQRVFGKDKKVVEINTVESVKCSANKLLMKRAFQKMNVKSADWWTSSDANKTNFADGSGKNTNISALPYPIVAKHIYGSRGTGNYLLHTQTELTNFLKGKDLPRYIFEKFYDYSREYRLHVSANGCFYTCRKMLKSDAPKEKRWFRNDSNSVWIMEDNTSFDKPSNWKAVEAECVKALKAVGLDVGAIDLRIQSAKTKEGKRRDNPDFIVIETNSAPSFGEVTTKKYIEELPKIINLKTK